MSKIRNKWAAGLFALPLAAAVVACGSGSGGGGSPNSGGGGGGGSANTEPPGLQSDGPLDVGKCQMTGTPGYSSYAGTVTVWNPSGSPQSISDFEIEWGSNGVLLSQQDYTLGSQIPSQTSEQLTAPAPPSATECVLAGWNP